MRGIFRHFPFQCSSHMFVGVDAVGSWRKVDYDDVDLAKRVWVKEPEDEGIRALQSTVQGAVKRLSEDLYSGEVPFGLW